MTEDNASEERALAGDTEDDAEVQPSTEPRSRPKLNKNEFRAEVRNLIDLGIQSGLSAEEMEEELCDLAKGTDYYVEDMMRYTEPSGGEGEE